MDIASDFNNDDGYSCQFCDRSLTSQELEVLDNLFDLEEKLADDTLNAIVYIGDYIEMKLKKTNKTPGTSMSSKENMSTA